MMPLPIYIFLLLFWLFTGSGVNSNQKSKKTQLSTINQDTIIFDCPTFTPFQKTAQFPSGIKIWRKYLEDRLQYPQAAIDNNIEAVVKVQMTVQTNGTVTGVKALNDPGFGLADEAVRVLKRSPKWRPAIKSGRRTLYTFVQTITFEL